MAREAEFEEQKQRRAYLEGLQPVSNPEGPRPEPPATGGDVRFDGCKTC